MSGISKPTKPMKKKRPAPVKEFKYRSDEIEEDEDRPKTPDSDWVESS